MTDTTNLHLINTGHIDDAETLMAAVNELLPKAQHFMPDGRADAYEEVVDKLAQAVGGLTILMRQITDGLFNAEVVWAEMK